MTSANPSGRSRVHLCPFETVNKIIWKLQLDDETFIKGLFWPNWPILVDRSKVKESVFMCTTHRRIESELQLMGFVLAHKTSSRGLNSDSRRSKVKVKKNKWPKMKNDVNTAKEVGDRNVSIPERQTAHFCRRIINVNPQFGFIRTDGEHLHVSNMFIKVVSMKWLRKQGIGNFKKTDVGKLYRFTKRAAKQGSKFSGTRSLLRKDPKSRIQDPD